MIDQQAVEQARQELRDLREAASRLVAQRDRARRWAVRCESLLAAAVVLLREDATWPCLDCHQGEYIADAEGTPQRFDPDHHQRGCRIAAVLQGAGVDSGSLQRAQPGGERA